MSWVSSSSSATLSTKQFWEQGSPQEILAKHGKTFNWARSFLGQKAGDNAARLYAFCRYLDDIADGEIEGGYDALLHIKKSLKKKTPAHDQVVLEFMNFATGIGIDFQVLDALLDGLLEDQNEVLLESRRDLLRYAYKVAGTVGVMMCAVLGCHDKRAYAFAIDLGIAMQLTNIARDVMEDAENNRRYLPASWCAGLTPQQIRAAAYDETSGNRLLVQTAIEETLYLADIYYQSALKGLAFLPMRAHIAIAVAAQNYRAIGHKIRKQHFTFWDGRMFVPLPAKIWHSSLSFKYLAYRLGEMPEHDNSLHANLEGLPHVTD
ncbi:MAG: phytoene/squalene synthase family protein [Parvibaculales bacterium]